MLVVCFQPFVSSEMLLYTQASGHRRVLVKPVNQCTEKCTSQLVIMEPGDSCKYKGDHYVSPIHYTVILITVK